MHKGHCTESRIHIDAAVSEKNGRDWVVHATLMKSQHELKQEGHHFPIHAMEEEQSDETEHSVNERVHLTASGTARTIKGARSKCEQWTERLLVTLRRERDNGIYYAWTE